MEFDAVFVANGAGLPVFLNVPGENIKGVYSANEYLTRINLMKAYDPESSTPVLRAKQVVVSRKSGNQVYYSLRDPVLSKVLDLLRQYFYAQLNESRTMLSDLQRADRETKRVRAR